MPNDTASTVEVITSDVQLPREDALLTPAEKMLRAIEDLIIDAPAMYDIAGTELQSVKGKMKALEEERLALTRPLDDVKARIMARFAVPRGVLERAEAALKDKMLAYRTECERRADEERKTMEAAARAERERLEREAAERRRIAEQEATANRIKAEEEAEAARKSAQQEANRLAAAGQAREAAAMKERSEREAGEKRIAAERDAEEHRAQAEEDARALERTAAVVMAVAPTTIVPSAKGTSVRGRWKARVKNLGALIAYVANNPQYENLLEANQSALDAQARSLHERLCIDGVEAFEERGVAARASA